MMTRLAIPENANFANLKGKRRKGNPMTTHKQILIEAVNESRIDARNMDHHYEYVDGYEDALSKALKLIEEILPNE